MGNGAAALLLGSEPTDGGHTKCDTPNWNCSTQIELPVGQQRLVVGG